MSNADARVRPTTALAVRLLYALETSTLSARPIVAAGKGAGQGEAAGVARPLRRALNWTRGGRMVVYPCVS
jgi:hypothetical protein